ncbi:UDP-N-acetylglucosamine 2-epimerase [compost metagenome]
MVRLVGPEFDTIVTHAQRLLDDPTAYGEMARGISPYGDGRASERIIALLRDHFA